MPDAAPTDILRSMSEAVLAITAELSWERASKRMVETARSVAGATYAALGIPDGRGGFDEFITAGMTPAQYAAIGPLPRTHGLLGAMLEDPAPYHTPDIQSDDRYIGWPDAHPDMRSFMGVPIVSKGAIIGAFYLTDKIAAPDFTPDDQLLIEMLASHAAIAIENARLYERSRELSVVEERNRLARELHDSVTQTLFSVVLSAESASTLIDRDPERAKTELTKLQGLARDAYQEMRDLIFELRSAELESDGLVATLRKHVDVVRRVRRADVELAVTGARRLAPKVEQELFRIAQEALNNALNHADAAHITIALDITDARARLTVRDDGRGFDPEAPSVQSKRLGLTSMRERAASLAGSLRIESSPGCGATVRVDVSLV
jgi:signal transduction histidine kinase